MFGTWIAFVIQYSIDETAPTIVYVYLMIGAVVCAFVSLIDYHYTDVVKTAWRSKRVKKTPMKYIWETDSEEEYRYQQDPTSKQYKQRPPKKPLTHAESLEQIDIA